MRRPMAVSGLVIIICAALLSIFAYQVIADDTPDANDQHVDIALASPGAEFDFLHMIKDSRSSNDGSWYAGRPSEYVSTVVRDITYSEESMLITNGLGDQEYVNYDKVLSSSDLTLPFADRKEAVGKFIKTQKYWLGTDKYGRSVLSRLVLGIRVSMLAGLIAVLVSLLIGITLGALGGYFGGVLDRIVMYFVNVLWSIPTLLLVFAIVLALGRGLGVIFIAVGLTMWVDVARIVRGQVLALKHEQYVLAARSLGQSEMTILLRHVLPNCIGAILVVTAANFATAILIEAGLSYLGFGVNPPTPSLGNMLNENYGYALSGNLTVALAPAVTIMILVLAFNLLGTGLRDVFDLKEV